MPRLRKKPTRWKTFNVDDLIMLILYIKNTCFFCRKVLEFATAHQINLTVREIYSDPKIMAELIERGGHRQVPYLIDEHRGVNMYESDDIINYLKENYDH